MRAGVAIVPSYCGAVEGAHGRYNVLSSVGPYYRLQDRAKLKRETWNLEREMRWSKTSGLPGLTTFGVLTMI
jgi:hypothetical protein